MAIYGPRPYPRYGYEYVEAVKVLKSGVVELSLCKYKYISLFDEGHVIRRDMTVHLNYIVPSLLHQLDFAEISGDILTYYSPDYDRGLISIIGRGYVWLDGANYLSAINDLSILMGEKKVGQ